jgi:hypothetical protein
VTLLVINVLFDLIVYGLPGYLLQLVSKNLFRK